MAPTKKVYKRKAKVMTLKKLTKAVKKLKTQTPDNPKYIYAPSASLSASINAANPLIKTLNVVTSGTTEITRIGDKCRMHYLNLNLELFRVAAASDGECNVRVLLVREYTCLGSAISLSQFMNNAAPDTTDVQNINSRDKGRFHILMDKHFIMGPNIVSTTTTVVHSGAVPSHKFIKIHKKMAFVTDYSRGVAGDVTDIDTNSLSLIVITDLAASSDLNAYATYTIQFYDA